MSGGLLQLEYSTAYNFLSFKPEFNPFTCMYKRHTNFSMSSVELASLNYGWGRTSNIKLERMGDLITQMTLMVRIPPIFVNKQTKFAWVKKLGLALIKYVKIYIGGTLIDSQFGEWMYLWLVLSPSNTRNKDRGYAILFGNVDSLIEYNSEDKPEYLLQIPLLFWFNRVIESALPIIAIRYQDVVLKVCFNELEKLIITNDPNFLKNYKDPLNMLSVSVLVNYVYLDLPERRLFAQSSHEYLIDQVLTDVDYVYSGENLIKLDFTKCCKELLWCSRNPDYNSNKRFLCYTHENDWTNTIVSLSYSIISDSMILSEKELSLGPLWTIIPPGITMVTKNKMITVENDSLFYAAINTDSLILDNVSITGKIKATVQISRHGQIQILDVKTNITIKHVSVPVTYFKDTRINNHDVTVNQFDNYGVHIDGSRNVTRIASLYCDSYELMKNHNSKVFNVLIPYYYYNISIPEGINVYPLCLFPQQFAPSGSINFSEFKSAYLKLWNDQYKNNKSYRPEYELLVFSRCYNRLIIDHGMIGLFV